MDVNLLVRFFVIQISFLHHSSHIPMEMHTQSSYLLCMVCSVNEKLTEE